MTPKFNHNYYGPYRILQSFNNVTFKLELPPHLKIHNAFHVSLLKRFHPDTTFGRSVPMFDRDISVTEPEAILKARSGKHGQLFYVKWRGRPLSDCTWVEEEELINRARHLVMRFYDIPMDDDTPTSSDP